MTSFLLQLTGHVGELVDALAPGLSGEVVVLDLVHVVLEDLEAVLALRSGAVVLAEPAHQG